MGRVLYAGLRVVVMALFRLWFRLEVTGREHVPADGAFIVAPVHRSNVDTPLAAAVTRRRLRFMGKVSMWKIAPIGKLWNLLGAFPVTRGTADREALRTCVAVIAGGEPLVIFPEGTRQTGPEVHPLFDGAAYVAAKTGVPILPVGIGGSEGAMPKGAKMIRPVKIAMVIGAPIRPPAVAEGERAPRRAVKEMTDQLAVALQQVFDEARKRAGDR